MAEMKLGKLPDRTPVKYAFTALPELSKRLLEYTAMYNEAHSGDEPEKLEDLLPFILDVFLDSDRAFARRMKQQKRAAGSSSTPPNMGQTRRRPDGAASASQNPS